MSHHGTEVPDGGEHGWVARALAADVSGPIPPAVGARIEDSLRAAAGATLTGERPQVFGGSTPARTSPFAAPPAVQRRPAQPGDTDVGDTTGRSSLVRRAGSRRGQRVEAAQDRRHRLLYRLLPAAAAVVVVAGSAAVAISVLSGRDEVNSEIFNAAATEESRAEAGPVPNGLVATGTAYSEGDLGQLALNLVAAAGSGELASAPEALADDQAAPGEQPAEAGSGVPAPAPDPTAPDPVAPDPVAVSPLASAEAFRACAQGLGAPEGVLPVAVDLATFEGTEAAVVVLPNRAGDGYEVIVTDRACSPSMQRATAIVLAP